MRNVILVSIGSILLLTGMGMANPPKAGELKLTVENIKKESGRIWVGIYASEADFLDREKARLVDAEIMSTGELVINVEDLMYGQEYALAVFHDENDNGELDRNFFGLPAEPWAFSGEPKTRLRLPRFEEVKFTFTMGEEQRKMKLRKW